MSTNLLLDGNFERPLFSGELATAGASTVFGQWYALHAVLDQGSRQVLAAASDAVVAAAVHTVPGLDYTLFFEATRPSEIVGAVNIEAEVAGQSSSSDLKQHPIAAHVWALSPFQSIDGDAWLVSDRSVSHL